MHLVNEIVKKMGNVSKPEKKFLSLLFTTILLIKGKVNFLNLSRYSTISERTYRRNFKKRFNFTEFNQHTIEQVVPATARQMFAQDASFISKSGKQTAGLGYFFNGCAGRPEKGLEISVISVIDVDANQGYTLSVKQTRAKENVSAPVTKPKQYAKPGRPKGKSKPKVKLTTEDTLIDFYLQHLQEASVYLPTAVRYGVFDGFFAKQKFVDGVCQLDYQVVSKLRIDANMRHLYQGDYAGRGRPKAYDGKVDIKDLSRFEFVKQLEPNLWLYTGVVYHMSLKRKIRLAILVNTEKKSQPRFVLLFSSDINLSALDIYHYYKARFQIEFLFRDAKQFTGLQDCQARDKQSLHFHFNAALAAVNLAKVDAWLHRDKTKPFVFSLATHKQLAFNRHLLNFIFSNLDLDLNSMKNHPKLQDIIAYGSFAA
jgi:hypothetical protein